MVSASPEDIERSRAYVEAIATASFSQQAARWIDPICTDVSGLPSALADRVAARITGIAAQVGAKVAAPKCKPNLLVVFAPDAGAFTQRSRQSAPAKMREIPKRMEEFVFRSQAPVRWWYTTDVANRDGRPLNSAVGDLVSCPGPCELPSLPNNVKSQTTYSSSRISAPTIRHIKSAVVVIDVPLATGRAIDSLADYAALVSLAEIWPQPGAQPARSILGLFDTEPFAAAPDDDAVVPGLGSFDRRFLCELYRLPLDRSGQAHKGSLIRAVATGTAPCFEAAGAF
ncbi:MAG: hypothetical protein ACXIT4_07320 [Erythrobacter sp.]